MSKRLLVLTLAAALAALSLGALSLGLPHSAVGAAACTPTGFIRDGIDLTAAMINPTAPVSGDVDATGCNIGVYYDAAGSGGTVANADVHGANYFGVVVNGTAVDIENSQIHDIGEQPFNGAQHGVAIYYTNGATGTVDGNVVSAYQKNGVTITGAAAVTITNNVVSGLGPVDFIAQNGIQISGGATALIQGNSVTGNDYTPPSFIACGILYFDANGVRASSNDVNGNERNKCNVGKGGGQFNPST